MTTKLLKQLEMKAIKKHIDVNRKIYGNNADFYTQVFLGIVTAPFKLAKNRIKKLLS